MNKRSNCATSKARYWWSLTCPLVIGCMIPSVVAAQVSQAQLSDVNDRGYACIGQNSRELDDGVTNVTSIAGIAVNMCREVRDEWLILFVQANVSPSDIRRVDLNRHRMDLRTKDIEAATIYILKNRAAKR